MYLLIHAETGSEWNTDVNSVAIEISRKILRKWLHRAQLYKNLKKQDFALTSLDYFPESDVAWRYGSLEDEKAYISFEKPEMNENCDSSRDENTIVASEVDRVAIDDYDFRFTAYIDNTSVEISTSISLKLVRRMYRALIASKKQLGLMLNEKEALVMQIVEARLKGTIK
jgi:hypothetical protein